MFAQHIFVQPSARHLLKQQLDYYLSQRLLIFANLQPGNDLNNRTGLTLLQILSNLYLLCLSNIIHLNQSQWINIANVSFLITYYSLYVTRVFLHLVKISITLLFHDVSILTLVHKAGKYRNRRDTATLICLGQKWHMSFLFTVYWPLLVITP